MTPADEATLFRFTIKHSIFLMMVMGIISMIVAYVFPGLSTGRACGMIRGAFHDPCAMKPF